MLNPTLALGSGPRALYDFAFCWGEEEFCGFDADFAADVLGVTPSTLAAWVTELNATRRALIAPSADEPNCYTGRRLGPPLFWD